MTSRLKARIIYGLNYGTSPYVVLRRCLACDEPGTHLAELKLDDPSVLPDMTRIVLCAACAGRHKNVCTVEEFCRMVERARQRADDYVRSINEGAWRVKQGMCHIQAVS